MLTLMRALCVQVPFGLGVVFMSQHEKLMRSMWLEMSSAQREARSTNANAAAERHRAWQLETARREMLVARKSAHRTKPRRGALLHAPRAMPDGARMDAVVQEDGYHSPALTADGSDD